VLNTVKWRNANWIGYILRRNCLLQQLWKRGCKGSEDEEEAIGSYWMTLREQSVLGTERGSSRCHSVENLLWNWLWTCRKTDCAMIDIRAKSFSDSWLIHFCIIHRNVIWVAGTEVKWTKTVVVSICTTFFNVKNLHILPTECVILTLKSDYFLNAINWLVFVIETQCVDCEVRTKFLYITLIKFSFQMYNLWTEFWSESQMLTKTSIEWLASGFISWDGDSTFSTECRSRGSFPELKWSRVKVNGSLCAPWRHMVKSRYGI
jgi:hypothetical protein